MGENIMTRVLVAYGSTRGGTEGVAQMIGEDLREHGHDAVVRPAAEVTELADVDAVVVAGALYAGRWHKDARKLVRRQAGGLAKLPVWLVATGPLGESTPEVLKTVKPVGHVRAAAERIGARGTKTFGGRLLPDAPGLVASSMAKKMAGDWRDPDEIATWVGEIDEELRATA
jgi:menaquinone-dependent protoporphyrinogen oxidase